jgi:hypothetical protein
LAAAAVLDAIPAIIASLGVSSLDLGPLAAT